MNHILVGVGIEVTADCNLKCLHCLVKGGERHYSLPYDDIICVLDQLASLKAFTVEISGGEPLVRKDLFDLLSHAVYERNLPITLSTNGTLITKRIARSFSKLDIEIAVSLDGSRPKVHDLIRSNTGAFSRTVRGVKNLVSVGIKPSIRTVVTKMNLRDLENIAVLCRELQAKDVLFMRFVPIGRGAENLISLKISRDDLREVFNRVLAMQRNPNRFGIVNLDCASPFPAMDRDISTSLLKLRACPACHTSLNITSTGDVEPCPMLRGLVVGNIKENTLDSIWHGNSLLRALREIRIDGCADCVFFCKSCYGGCRGYVFQMTGDVVGKDNLCWRRQSISELKHSAQL